MVRPLRAQGSGLQFNSLQQLPAFVGLLGASWGGWPGGCQHLSWRKAHCSPEGRAERVEPGARTAGLTWDPDKLLSFLSPLCSPVNSQVESGAMKHSVTLQGVRLVIHS